MPLPGIIEIVPLAGPVHAEITVPGSKSITNRALILAALARGRTTLRGALWSDDTQVMVEALRTLGFSLDVQPDPAESGNRTITIEGQGGKVPPGGTDTLPLELFVGNAGTAARFLAALVCLGCGVYRLSGVPRMHERPQAALFSALRELGYRVKAANERLPATIFGTGPRPGSGCTVGIEKSSQFASALLLCAGVGGWKIQVVGEDAEESPYVAMTSKLIAAFPKGGGEFQVEPDTSSGSYFWAAGRMELVKKVPVANQRADGRKESSFGYSTRPSVLVNHWPCSGWQFDQRYWSYFVSSEPLTSHWLSTIEGRSEAEIAEERRIEAECGNDMTISRLEHLGDSIMTAIVLAPLLIKLKRAVFIDLGRLRLQECERVVALRTELTKCGARVEEVGDTLIVHPSELHGAEIETYDDHRMAMCFATLGLKVPGVKLKNPACVKKTFPNFFQKLAAAPPQGLGATILDAVTGRALSGDDLLPG